MKTSFKLWLPAVLIVFLVAAGGEKPAPRLATVDLRKAYEKYYRREQALKAVEQEKDDIVAKLKTMQEEGRKLVDENTKLRASINDALISTEERTARTKKANSNDDEIKARELELETYKTHAQEQLELENQRVTEQIIKEIRAVITSKAKAGGFTYVIDKSAVSASGAPMLLYTADDNDLTDDILKELNAAAPTASPAVNGKPDAKK